MLRRQLTDVNAKVQAAVGWWAASVSPRDDEEIRASRSQCRRGVIGKQADAGPLGRSRAGIGRPPRGAESGTGLTLRGIDYFGASREASSARSAHPALSVELRVRLISIQQPQARRICCSIATR